MPEDFTLQIREILENLGYNLQDHGDTYRTQPLYRPSETNSKTVLCINKTDGRWYDFKTNQRGDIISLAQLTLGIKDRSEVQKKLQIAMIPVKKERNLKLTTPKIFSSSDVKGIVSNHSYWEKRGVKKRTLEIFQGGVMDSGMMKNRYVFPIISPEKKIVGFSGRRLVENDDVLKWKHKGKTSTWVYPAFVNEPVIRRVRKVMLIESIGDMLSLWDARIRNCLVVFGLRVNTEIINFLLRMSPDEIHICFNKDEKGYGQKGAFSARKKLSKFFNNVKVFYPSKNDFGEMSTPEILNWAKHREIPII